MFPFEYNVFPDGGEIYGIDDYGICKLSIPTGSVEYLLYWFDVDISSSEIECLKVSSNGDIYYNSGHSLVKLHKEATNPYAGRRLIYVAVQSMDSRYMKLINEYNKSPDSKGRIVLYTPSTSTDETVYSRSGEADAADRLLLDMKSGTGPDVLINYSEFSQFDTGSILVDLNPYLDGADGIDRRMYFDNVFRAFEVDGQLFQMPLSIYLDTLLGNPDYISGVSDWTLDEFSDKMRSLPEDVKPILYTDASVQGALEPIGILLNLLYRDMPHYVDYSKGEVRFDSDDFRKLMQIAKEIAPGISQDTIYEMFEEIGEDAYHEPKYIVMQSGLCALTTVGCRHLYDFASAADLCHSEVSFIGWPTSSGKGVSAEATMTVGISAFTDEEGRAVSWDFIRFLLSSESQDKMAESGQSLGFSVCRKSLNISLQNAIDENNKNINERDPEPGMSPKMDQGTSDQLIALMERVSTRYIVNPTIVNIIREEAPAYFDGSKSAEDVSRTIQNRAATLMAETA
ncbi:MAG: extracellular solute-binding protein [Clostridiales bacterium]|nr:extracellular solute-binding protein [Clostridiales bacterium]